MYRPTIYEASPQQLQEIYAMSDDDASKLSADLATTHQVQAAYFPNMGMWYQGPRGSAALDVGRTAYELCLRVTDQPPADASYEVAPYCVPSERLIRGIALWVPIAQQWPGSRSFEADHF